MIWRQDCYQLPTGRTSFGFKDGIGQPAVEGSGIPGSNPKERPIKAGEFILGYPDETGSVPPMPTPEVLGRNGTYVVFRKLHTRVAAYRQYLRAKAASREEEALLGAKMVGRWQSGAPLALAPDQDDPELGADPKRNNDFGYGDDLRGFKCPAGAHARRANPRDALDDEGSVDVRLHRMIRRGTSYGPMLPDGVLEDDGVDRGIIFVFAGAHLKRQFEFVKTQWLNDGIFIGAPTEKDPLVGANDGSGVFTIPQRPIRRRLREPAAVRRHPRRRVLLRAGPARVALAGGARDLRDREEDDVATTPTGTDRWKALDFGPPPSDLAEPDQPVLVEYVAGERVARHHPEPAARRQRDHDRDGRAPDGDPRDDRGPSRRPRRRHHRRRRPRLLRRQRPAPAQGHDEGGLAAPAAGLRPHALHAAPAAEADLRRRQRRSPTAAARRSPRAPTSSSPPRTRPSASPRR